MDTRMKWRLALMPFALAGLVAPLVSACGEDPLGDLCCKEFTAGADLSGVDWGIKGDANAQFSAFMQVSADFAGSASAMVNDVTGACKGIALDLGGDGKTITATDPGEAAKAWCALAVAQIKAQVKGSLTIKYQPPSAR